MSSLPQVCPSSLQSSGGHDLLNGTEAKCPFCQETIKTFDRKIKQFGYSYEYEKFVNIIEPFIIPTMTYKIANPRNDLAQLRWSYSEHNARVANTSVPIK